MAQGVTATLWGIIGAMDEEIDALCQKADISEKVVRYGCTFYRGSLEGKTIVFVCCGIGKVNAALCATTLIHFFEVDRIVHIGIAGALSPALDCLDLVIASDAAYHDIEPGVLQSYFPYCDRFPADISLVKLAERVCGQLTAMQGRKALTGRLISGDRFIASTDKKQMLGERFGAICVEMEGAAVAHVAFVHQIPFLILRTISDSLGDEGMIEYQRFKPLACEQATQMICALLRDANS